MKTFKAPWGKPLVWISTGSTLLLLGLPLLEGVWFQPRLPWPHRLWVTGLPLAILLCALPFVVRGYTVGREALLIQRLWWSTRLPHEDLLSVESEPEVMSGSIRTFGNGGLFSFTGWYWSRELRTFRAYVTDSQKTVVLRYSHRTVVVSPDDPQAFVRSMSAAMLKSLADTNVHPGTLNSLAK